ncbi:hypothetical protein L484_003952 [Morus notabilis]|uniref:PLAT domain-containing protein n=1 Tax=Morus notabilis TaxID=981085 RepID=W9RJ27_9ROSA|nr:PLAT domain-containing protein 1 [Morus notabilis]EXB93680.1 hypothetical protein L484_003952 [Morus notabilis]
MELRRSLLFSLFFLTLSVLVISDSDPDCVYTIYVRTGSVIKGGTDSKISAQLFSSDGYGILIKDLEKWGGLMGPDYNYFERGNLDIFSGRGPCLEEPICKLNLTSDGSGPHHGWYVNYVEITSTGVHIPCHQQQFEIEQWLASDTSPYELTAIRDYCPKRGGGGGGDNGVRHQVKTASLPQIGRLSSVVV